VIGYTMAGSFIILKVVDLIFNLNVTAEDKVVGQDFSQHGENVQVFDMKNLREAV
jgi:ammonium transporter, Amt family